MASGDSLCFFIPHNAEFPDADAAALDSILSSSTDEPDHVIPFVAFDPGATDEYMYLRGFMPAHYGGGGVTLTIGWSAAAVTGVCRWAAAFKSLSDDADVITTKAFAAPNTVDATVASIAREIDYATITFTDGADMDSVAAEEMFVLEISRNSSNAADTMNSNDAELQFVLLQET